GRRAGRPAPDAAAGGGRRLRRRGSLPGRRRPGRPAGGAALRTGPGGRRRRRRRRRRPDGRVPRAALDRRLERRAGHQPLDSGAPFYDCYETADGEYVAVGALEPKFFATLVDRLGLAGEDLPAQYDRHGWPQLRKRLAETFMTRTRQEWCDLLEGTDACFAPV